MSNIDNFLANLSKDVSIDDSKPNKKTVVKENSASKSSKTKSKKSKDDDFKMDGNILFEGQQGEHKSILDDINLPEDTDFRLDPEIENTRSLNESSEVNENIRAIIREELDSYFKNKMILGESSSSDAQIIFLKVGNSLFKGNMEFVKSV